MATTDKRVSVTELDFDDIKTNLKTFMRNQNEFTDYDFEEIWYQCTVRCSCV